MTVPQEPQLPVGWQGECLEGRALLPYPATPGGTRADPHLSVSYTKVPNEIEFETVSAAKNILQNPRYI